MNRENVHRHSVKGPSHAPSRLIDRFGAGVRSSFWHGPGVKSFALVAGAVVLWASWPALAIHLALKPAHPLTLEQGVTIAAMGIGPFTVANVFRDRATRQGSAATISSLAFLTPLVAMGLPAVFGLGDVTTALLVGALLAVTGALLSSRAA